MSFPVVAGFGGSNSGANVTTSTIDLAALAGTASPGDLIVIIFGIDEDATPTWPGGWTQLLTQSNPTISRGQVYYRRVVSGDATSINVTHASQGTAWQVYRLTGAGQIVGAVGTIAGGNPNPPASPAWSTSWDTLYIAACANNYDVVTTSGPSSYTNFQSDIWANADGFEVASARRELNASSENPGAFTTTGSSSCHPFTIAIAGGGSGYPLVRDCNGTNSGGNVTTSTVDIAALVGTPQAGDLIIITIVKDGTGAFTWPGSPAFSAFAAGFPVTFASTNNQGVLDARYRVATGTETTCALTHATESTAWEVIRIAAGSWASGTNPEAGSITGDSTNPDPPSLNPGAWDVERTLWLAVGANDGNVAITAQPSGYFGFRNDRVAASTGAGIAIAWIENAVAAENPGVFTMNTEQWGAATIAIRQSVSSPTMLPLSYLSGLIQR